MESALKSFHFAGIAWINQVPSNASEMETRLIQIHLFRKSKYDLKRDSNTMILFHKLFKKYRASAITRKSQIKVTQKFSFLISSIEGLKRFAAIPH